MSSTYTATPGTTADPLEITEPSDGDALAAASVNTALSQLADAIAYHQLAAGHVCFLNEGTVMIPNGQTFPAGNPVTFDDVVTMEVERHSTTVPTSDSDPVLIKEWLADDYTSATDRYFRIYMAGSAIWWLYNASWDSGTSKWHQDDAAAESGGFILGKTSGGFVRKAAGVADWAIGDWGTGSIVGAGRTQSTDTISSATPGAGQAVSIGDIYKDTAPVGWAYVQVTGGAATLLRGANIKAVNRTSAGVITVQVENKPSNVMIGIVTPSVNANTIATTIATATDTITVYMFNSSSGAVADNTDFQILLFGG